jgi:hypothetical protein
MNGPMRSSRRTMSYECVRGSGRRPTTSQIPTEQPERRVSSVLRERENELSVEVVVDIAPRVPPPPLFGVVAEHIDRERLTVIDRAVELAMARIEARGK